MGKSEVSVSAGLSSAPEASESTTSSKGFLGVVKAGFRKAGADGFKEPCCGVKSGRGCCDLDGVANGLGRDEAPSLDGEAKGLGRDEALSLDGEAKPAQGNCQQAATIRKVC